MAGYQELKVWQVAMRLTSSLYRVTASFPQHEIYGLSSQLRRAGVSVPSNLAEGHARGSKREMVRFCRIAKGSIAEIETQLFVAVDLGYIASEVAQPLLGSAAEVGRMINGLIRSFKDADGD
jgi:four helix bundle protein